MHQRSRLRAIAIGSLAAAIVAGGYPAPARAVIAGADPSVSVALDHDVYRLGDSITGTMTVTNAGDTAAAAGVVVHVFYSTMHINSIDFGAFTKTNTTSAVLNRPMEAGETLQVVVHASATGFLLAPPSNSFTGRVDYTGDASKTNNWDQVTAAYNTSGQVATVAGTVFNDTNRDGVRQSGEPGDLLAGPSLWWAPGQGQGVGIHTDGQYSFTGIIGQEYELHFDVNEPATYVGTSERIHIFTLSSGGRTINYGVVARNAPTAAPTTPGATATPHATATSGTPSTPHTSPPATHGPGSTGVPSDRSGGTQAVQAAAVTSASPTSAAASNQPTGEAAAPGTSEIAAPAPRSGTSGSSTWLWLVIALAGLAAIGAVFARRAYRARSAD